MKINGKQIANEFLIKLKHQIETEAERPILAIIQIGNLQESSIYIHQKIRAGAKLGIKVVHQRLPENTKENALVHHIAKYNTDNNIHGIIVQLPLPANLNTDRILSKISPAKDVDGFRPHSFYTPPVACAVLTALQFVKNKGRSAPNFYNSSFSENLARGAKNQNASCSEKFKAWLGRQKLAIVGRGKTGGKPIQTTFNLLNIPHTIIHTQTKNAQRIMQKADVVISCVGKPKIVTAEKIKPGAILIGVGVHRGKNGKLHGDYDETEIKNKAAFYTPTVGGIGPLTVACLMKNVVISAYPGKIRILDLPTCSI